MKEVTINLMLIGFGHHARRIYYPICKSDSGRFNFRLVCAVDIEENREDLQAYLTTQHDAFLEVYYVSPSDRAYNELPTHVCNALNHMVRRHNVHGVIISTEPHAHMIYARWALRKGLSILMDKPVSVRDNASISQSAATELVKDYTELAKVYEDAKMNYRRVLCSIMTQRRYHPAYQMIKQLVTDVFKMTNCPITSIQSFHCDGMWWMPPEIVDIDYHPHNRGYGKCLHSGYHFFDIVHWWLEAAENQEKSINNVEVCTSLLRPSDFLQQLTVKDYERLFVNFKEYNKYTEEELMALYRTYGEIDAFSTFAFRHDERVLTLGSINLAHNGFSQRGWMSCAGRDLYKGNGRVRHEQHIIEQGPFQAIYYISCQSKEVDINDTANIYDVGGEYHGDVYVFRNNNLFPQWKAFSKYSMKDMNVNIMTGKSRGHQEDARRNALLELVAYLRGSNIIPVSDLSTHWRTVQLIYGVYSSAARRFKGENPSVSVDF